MRNRSRRRLPKKSKIPVRNKGGSSYGLLVTPTYHALPASFAAFKTSRLQGIYTQADSATDLVWISIPFLIWLFIFKYFPIWGWTIAFQDFKPARKLLDQQWVGLKRFYFLFQDEHFLRVMRNTLAISFINLVLGFITTITLAILLNGLRQVVFKRVVQTLSYLPHFISWVVAASIISTALSANAAGAD
ncbi:hypothetical protein KAI37_05036 [Paenibacillus sp. S25]|nr:hypothetical protein KAI37_05036 [Paenibacillus sp. S25]